MNAKDFFGSVRDHLGWLHVSLASFLLLTSVFSLLLLERKTTTHLSAQLKINNDSIRLARAYGDLLLETIDLQQELYARNAGPIPLTPKVTKTPGDALDVRPVPRAAYVELSDSDQASALRAISSLPADRGGRGRVQLTYSEHDIEEANTGKIFERLGFTVIGPRTSSSQPSNTIMFGDSVPLEDVRIVAMRLIASGIRLSRVRRLDPTNANAWSLTISSVSYAADWPLLSVAQINRMIRQ